MLTVVGVFAVVVAFAVLVYVIFFMERSNSALLQEQRIDLQSMTGKRVPILLEFGKGWCRPCKYMKPILEDMAKDYGRKGHRGCRGHGRKF